MSIFRSLSTAISGSLDTITSTAKSLEKTLDIANIYVENNHKRVTKTVRQDAILSTAIHHAGIIAELDADEKLKAAFEALEADW